MANETNTTTMTGAINASLISRAFLNYQCDPVVMAPHCRLEKLQPGTKTAAFAVPTKGAATATSEADMSNVALTFANVTVAVAEYGVLREVSKLASRTSLLAEAELMAWIAQDGYRLCMDKFEVDLFDQASNASTSFGTSGAQLQIAHFASAVSQLAIAKAQGVPVGLMSGYAMRDLRSSFVSSSASVWVNANAQLAQVPDADGYCGQLLGVDLYVSNNPETSGADRLSILQIDGARFPANAATGVAYAWMPEVQIGHALPFSGQYAAVTMAYGAAEIADWNYVKFASIGS